MNNSHLSSHSNASLETLQARFALRLTARLSEQEISQDAQERLRFAREQALMHAKASRVAATSSAINVGSSLALNDSAEDGNSRGRRVLITLLPLFALLGGLFLIQYWHNQNQISAAAEIEALLLADDLPPSAYSDPGFLEFLKAPVD